MKKYILFIIVLTFLKAAACFAESSMDDFLERTEEARALEIDLLLPKTPSGQLGIRLVNPKSEETLINRAYLDEATGIRFSVTFIDINGEKQELYTGSGGGYPYDIPDNEKTLKSIKNGEILYSQELNNSFIEICNKFPQRNTSIDKILSISVKIQLFNTIRVKDSKNMSFYVYADFTQDMIDSFFPQFSSKEKIKETKDQKSDSQ